MSDTPISDSTPHNPADLGMLCRKLERQLNAANERIKELEADVKAYKTKAIEDGERIYTLGTRLDRYRMTLLEARERIKKLESKSDELQDLKKWLEGR
jgi:chromosome segregation ATPase